MTSRGNNCNLICMYAIFERGSYSKGPLGVGRAFSGPSSPLLSRHRALQEILHPEELCEYGHIHFIRLHMLLRKRSDHRRVSQMGFYNPAQVIEHLIHEDA